MTGTRITASLGKNRLYVIAKIPYKRLVLPINNDFSSHRMALPAGLNSRTPIGPRNGVLVLNGDDLRVVADLLDSLGYLSQILSIDHSFDHQPLLGTGR